MPKSVAGVMREFKEHQLHSGSRTGNVVTNRKQAIAIAINEQKVRGAALHPALKQRAQMVKEAHAHLSEAMPGFTKFHPTKQFAMTQHHVKIRNGGL